VPFPFRKFRVRSAGFSPLLDENGLKPALEIITRETSRLKTAVDNYSTGACIFFAAGAPKALWVKKLNTI
jgi:hypothetical protein